MKKTKKTKKSESSFTEKKIEMTKPNESQKVVVKGTGKARKQTATWY
jgi:hypothetical protein